MQEGYLIPTGMPISRLTQIYRHNLYNGEVGDCYRTALACLLTLNSPRKVPHFVRESIFEGENNGWVFQKFREWLRLHEDLDLAYIDLDDLVTTDAHYMLSVHSKYGPWYHVVIGKGEEIVWDPAGWKAQDPYTLEDRTADAAEVLCWPYIPTPPDQRALWRQGIPPNVFTPS